VPIVATPGQLGTNDPLATANSGLDPNQSSALTAALTASNPLISGVVGAELPSIAQYGQSFNQAEAGIAGLSGSQAYQDALLQGSTGLQQAQLTNQGAANTLQEQNVAQQLGIQGGQNALAQQLAGIQQGQLNYNLPIAQSQAQSQGAATGTLNTQGYKQKYGQIGEQYQVSSAELANQLAGQNLTFKGQQESAANQQAQLANTAASLGISGQQLQNQLSSGLAQIGVQTGQTGDQLLQQASQAQAGEAQGLGAILSNIGALTGSGPQAFAKSFPNLYPGGT
jgi:hypothetical protein